MLNTKIEKKNSINKNKLKQQPESTKLICQTRDLN